MRSSQIVADAILVIMAAALVGGYLMFWTGNL